MKNCTILMIFFAVPVMSTLSGYTQARKTLMRAQNKLDVLSWMSFRRFEAVVPLTIGSFYSKTSKSLDAMNQKILKLPKCVGFAEMGKIMKDARNSLEACRTRAVDEVVRERAEFSSLVDTSFTKFYSDLDKLSDERDRCAEPESCYDTFVTNFDEIYQTIDAVYRDAINLFSESLKKATKMFQTCNSKVMSEQQKIINTINAQHC